MVAWGLSALGPAGVPESHLSFVVLTAAGRVWSCGVAGALRTDNAGRAQIVCAPQTVGRRMGDTSAASESANRHVGLVLLGPKTTPSDIQVATVSLDDNTQLLGLVAPQLFDAVLDREGVASASRDE